MVRKELECIERNSYIQPTKDFQLKMNSSKITKSLEKTNNFKGPTLFVIPIDYSENGKLTKFLDDLEKKYDT